LPDTLEKWPKVCALPGSSPCVSVRKHKSYRERCTWVVSVREREERNPGLARARALRPSVRGVRPSIDHVRPYIDPRISAVLPS